MKVVDKLPTFKAHAFSVLDDALREVSGDIFIKSKNRAPLKDGALRGEKEPIKRLAQHHWRVQYTIEYAGAQEAGKAGSRVFRNYTTAGTGAHFLEKSGDEYVKLNLKGVWKKHGKRARA